MSTRNFIIAGNWKMYKTIAQSLDWSSRFLQGYTHQPAARVVVFPPSTALASLSAALQASGVETGAQNLHANTEGAFTGEISGQMIREAGATWVLVGHSERRRDFGESHAALALKLKAALQAGLQPVYCVGESEQERLEGRQSAVVTHQLEEALASLDLAERRSLIIAYEPVWAIGTGRTASVEDAATMHGVIRQVMSRLCTHDQQQTAILYGGSVNPGNAGALFDHPEINGVLVGGASLEPDGFLDIVQEAQRRC